MTSSTDKYEWKTHTDAFAKVTDFVQSICERSNFVSVLASRMLTETGTRLIDWVDRIGCANPADFESVGFIESPIGVDKVWQHPKAMLPRVFETTQDVVAIHVDSVSKFLLANGLDDRVEIIGEPRSPIRRACVSIENDCELHVVERHGTLSWNPGPTGSRAAINKHTERFLLRRRDFADDVEGFTYAQEMFEAAANDVGTNRACEMFFAAERAYWQSRNRAARIQKMRQDKLGLGWANQDHHTYRSGRAAFPHLIRVLETMGFQCRERFYAGAEAGWGAQVLEQTDCRIVIFADVDLNSEEIAGDFAHSELPPQEKPGTVGLWCALHGEAFLQAGMHHLECQFDFDASREQLAAEGVETMSPFTDFDHLRQAFTVGERWQVPESRLTKAIADGFITEDEAGRFRNDGVIGSHLEILQRNDGYKGFNKTGISEIILETNPKTAT